MAVDQARLAALSSWEQIVLVVDSTIGKQLRDAAGSELAIETFGDTVADEATGTLRIRCLDFGRFVAWSRAEDLNLNPVLESFAYTYLKWLKEQAAAPTAGQ
eukprot:950430-Amphidinium_carterae.1